MEGSVEVIPRGCFGLCRLAPNLYVEPDDVWYSKFTLRDVSVIVRQHLREGRPVKRLIHYPDQDKKGGGVMTQVAAAREIEVGEAAPDFTLKDEGGNPVTLSSFHGKKNVVLLFYPFDWSPVCTTENCAVNDDLPKFDSKETTVLGISCDSHFCHRAWKEKMGFKHTLLSDQLREVSKKYGLYLPDLNCSKRATVVVNKEGKVTYKKVQELKTARSTSEILSALR